MPKGVNRSRNYVNVMRDVRDLLSGGLVDKTVPLSSDFSVLINLLGPAGLTLSFNGSFNKPLWEPERTRGDQQIGGQSL